MLAWWRGTLGSGQASGEVWAGVFVVFVCVCLVCLRVLLVLCCFFFVVVCRCRGVFLKGGGVVCCL